MTLLTTCPHCGGEVLSAAATCRHCQASLSTTQRPSATRVIVTDLDLPFASMVTLTVKWAIAAIPAAVILTAISAATLALLSVVLP